VTTYREMFEAELAAHGIAWCLGGCGGRRSHDNGGAFATDRTVHYNREIATRATLQIGLHEVGHIVLGHTERTAAGYRTDRRRAYEREAEAEAWSFQRMRELGVPIPEKSRERARGYVARKKARGDAVIAGKRRKARVIVVRRKASTSKAEESERGGA
jgi:hypothetical protein